MPGTWRIANHGYTVLRMTDSDKPILFPQYEFSKPLWQASRHQQLDSQLTNILQNATRPVVVSLEAEWGEGKTTFLSEWRKEVERELNDDQTPFCEINASVSEHISTPQGCVLFSLLQSIGRLEDADEVGATGPESLLGAIPNILARLVSGGSLGKEDFCDEEEQSDRFHAVRNFEKTKEEWQEVKDWLSLYGEWVKKRWVCL